MDEKSAAELEQPNYHFLVNFKILPRGAKTGKIQLESIQGHFAIFPAIFPFKATAMPQIIKSFGSKTDETRMVFIKL